MVDIDKLIKLKDDFIDDGFKSYFHQDTSSIDSDALFDILLDSIHSLDKKEKKVLKVILQSNDDFAHKKLMEDIEQRITRPLLKVVERLDQLSKEFYGNGKNN